MHFDVAIVGSGPAGFYAAEALLKSDLTIRVDMFERLPTPFGLVRYGVAPDHQKLKSVTGVFDKIAKDPNFTFVGNIEIGKDIDIGELQEAYDAVIIATGASKGKTLGVAGEGLMGIHSASDFVGWYNGHPDRVDLSFDFSHTTAVIVGQGNVALDVCRVLAKGVDELRSSDICEHALDALAQSKIRDIHLVGRRAPVHAKFTARELREFGELEQADPLVRSCDVASEMNFIEVGDDVPATSNKNMEILESFSSREPLVTQKRKRIHFRFFLSPHRLEGQERIERVVFAKNNSRSTDIAQAVFSTAIEEEHIEAGLLINSVGYRGNPVPGVPFDSYSATVPHRDGRVCSSLHGAAVPGLYVCGWIKRGPQGVIGTNRACAMQTAESLLSDFASFDAKTQPSRPNRRRDQFLHALRKRTLNPIAFHGWEKIDEAERAAGALIGKPREKLTNVQHMIDVALQTDSTASLT